MKECFNFITIQIHLLRTDAEEKPMNLWTGSKNFQMLYQTWFCLLNRGI